KHGVFDTTDVLIHGHPVVRGIWLDHSPIVVGGAVAQKVPGRLYESIHRVGLAARVAAATRASRAAERRMAGQWRAPLTAGLNVMRQHDREIFFLLRHHSASVAIEDRNQRSPGTLTPDPPVAQ